MKALWFCLFILLAVPAANAEDSSDLFENLVPVENAKMGAAYIDPNADFSVFKRVKILRPLSPSAVAGNAINAAEPGVSG